MRMVENCSENEIGDKYGKTVYFQPGQDAEPIDSVKHKCKYETSDEKEEIIIPVYDPPSLEYALILHCQILPGF